jgi:hypothetical protein
MKKTKQKTSLFYRSIVSLYITLILALPVSLFEKKLLRFRPRDILSKEAVAFSLKWCKPVNTTSFHATLHSCWLDVKLKGPPHISETAREICCDL